MKKVTQFSLFTILFLSASQVFAYSPAKNFNGFYLGGALGGSIKCGSGESLTTIADSFSNGDSDIYQTSQLFDLNSTPMFGGLYLGFGCVLCEQYYLGLEGMYSFSAYRKVSPSVITNEGIVSLGGSTIETHVSSNIRTQLNTMEFGLDIRPGVLLTPDTMLYGRIGITHNKFFIVSNSAYSFTNPGVDGEVGAINLNHRHKKRLFPIRFGIGLERRFANCYSLRVDYIHITYNEVSVASSGQTIISGPFGTSTTSITNNAKAKISSNTISIGLSYYW